MRVQGAAAPVGVGYPQRVATGWMTDGGAWGAPNTLSICAE